MPWTKQLRGDSISWVLEPDTSGARYLALRDLLDLPQGSHELGTALRQAHTQGPIAALLESMDPEGYWVEPGAGYYPKYTGSVWSVITLAMLGASSAEDERVTKACAYLLDNALTEGGQFSISGAPSNTVDCLQGNLCYALTALGCNDPRLEKAFEWMARSVTGEGVAPASERDAPRRYYAAKCGPLFACGANNRLSCAWGAAKVMLAFSNLPGEKRTPLIADAIQQGIDFLFSCDPADALYPSGYSQNPSRNWWKFGFPVFYITDLLQILEALLALGCGGDPRLDRALDLVRQKQDDQGRWALEYDYMGKTWVDFGSKSRPNKWVTLRALRVLKQAGALAIH
jgi:hypothetical protein